MFVVERGLVEAAVRARCLAGQAQALELRALADYARRRERDEFAYLEISTQLHISDRAAQRRIGFARELTERLTRTLAVLEQGHIEEFKAQLIADAVRYLTDEQALEVETFVLDQAAGQTPAQLRAALAKAVLIADPHGCEERRQAKKTDRRVCSQPTEDGEAVLSIYHSAATIAAMRAAIRGRAHQLKNAGGEARTLSQLEADVAAGLVLGSPEHHKVEVHLTMPVGPNTLPPEVDGVGPITQQAAFELAAEATTWRWIRTDPATGAVTDLTAPSYHPPAALAEFLKVRDRTCRFPGCTRPARHCDIDHLIPWPAGQTCDTNCTCLCRRHHRAKHEAGWHLHQPNPGLLNWTTPLGYLHQVNPTPVVQPHPSRLTPLQSANPPPGTDPPPF